MRLQPSKCATWLVEWLTSGTPHEDIHGDMLEEFEDMLDKFGPRRARLKFLATSLRLIRPFLLKYKFRSVQVPKSMLMGNYWKVTQRVLIRNKLYSLLNIFGLSIGLAASFILSLYVSNELSYDKFHDKKDVIYRILVTDREQDGTSTTTATSVAAIAPTMYSELAGVDGFVRFSSPSSGFLSINNKRVNVNNVLHADSSVFDIFSFRLLAGDNRTCLTKPYTIVLTPALAESLFGNNNPLGKVVYYNGEQPLTVTGIVEEPPTNSQVQFSCFISFISLVQDKLFLDWNGGWNYIAYVLLNPNTDISNLKSQFPDFMYRNINKMLSQFGVELSLDLQPLTAVHLGPEISGDWGTKGNKEYILVFGLVAFITLVMGSINFINLTAAQGITRLKEIGVRKSIGAKKSQLIKQFMFESFVSTLFAAILAILVLITTSSVLKEFTGYSLAEISLSNFRLGLAFMAIIIIVSVVSGVYPAFYLSSVDVDHSNEFRFTKQGNLSKTSFLTLFQSLISIILMSGTWYIYQQLQFIGQMDTGYQRENQVVIRLNSETSAKNYENLKLSLDALPEVQYTGASSDIPGAGFTSNGYVPEGRELPVMIHVLDIDESYLETMGLEVMLGQGFSKETISDDTAYLVNEALVKEMGWENPIGKKINRVGSHEVIGVVKDFNFASLHEKIEPLIFTNQPWRDRYAYLTVNISTTNLPMTLDKLEQTWRQQVPNDPFEFFFLDESQSELYSREKSQAKLLFTFTVLALLIGGMGLFGQVSYSLKRKTKEIGVRKVLGASPGNLLVSLSIKYILSIILATIIAYPVVHYIMIGWLENFAYRINLNPVIFLCSALFALMIALVTINVQAVLAIRQNPTESLKYE